MQNSDLRSGIVAMLQERIDNARTGKLLGVYFNEIAQRTGLSDDVLEHELKQMCRDGGVLRIGHPDFRQDAFTLSKAHRKP
jgi:hypothetical protein